MLRSAPMRNPRLRGRTASSPLMTFSCLSAATSPTTSSRMARRLGEFIIFLLCCGACAPPPREPRVCLGLLSPWLPFQSPFLRFPFSISDPPNGTENEGLVSCQL